MQHDNESPIKKSQKRLVPIQAFFAFAFVIVLARAYSLQILGSERLEKLATAQYTAKLVSQPKRGTIYDRNGNVLAMDIRVSSVGIHPHKVTDTEAVRKILAEHTELKPEEINKLLSSEKKFEWVARRIPKVHGDAIGSSKLAGLMVQDEYRRYYPHRELAGQVLGSVGYDAKALGGLELAYDPFLKSGPKTNAVERDARGRLITPLYNSEISYDLHLTLDQTIQSIAEKALVEGAEHHDVKSGFVIVMDPKSGDVLAMANYPTFDPNQYWKYEQEVWKNHAIIDTFEPGSTFKTILMAAALASGKIKGTDKFHCENGSYAIGKHVIHDHGGYGMLDAKTILQKSSNIGVTKIAMKIGQQTFYDFMKGIGFGAKTDIGFIGEEVGILRNYKNWQAIEFSNIAFGQGVTVTGIQMATAYSSIANNGIKLSPVLVRGVKNSNGQFVVESHPEDGKIMMDENAALTLQDMLYSVTQEGGTAMVAHIDGYHAAGKTGTAQKVNPKTRSYQPGEFVSSFIGFAPAQNPELVVYVVLDTPRKNGYYGGVAAAPIFKKITENSLVYLGVEPKFQLADKEKKSSEEKNVKNPQAAAKEKSADKTGKDSSQEEMALVDLVRINDWMASRAQDSLRKNVMPDLRGLPLRRVLQLTQNRGIQLKPKGSGIVVKQSVAPGQPLAAGQVVEIEMGGQS